MANKYPSVTASKSGNGAAVRTKPANFPKGKSPLPANDNKMGIVLLGKAPKKLRVFDPKALLELPVKFAQEVIWAAVTADRPTMMVNQRFPSQYWTWEPCPMSCGGHDLFTSVNLVPCATTCVAGRYNSNGSDFTIPPNPTNQGIWYVHWKTNVVPGPGLIQTRREGRYVRKVGAPNPTPSSRAIPLALPEAPLAWPVEAPLAWPVGSPRPRPAPVPYQAPRPGEEPDNRPEPETQPYPRNRPGRIPSYSLPRAIGQFPFVVMPGPSAGPAPTMPSTDIKPGKGSVPSVARGEKRGRREPPNRRGRRRRRKHEYKVKMKPWQAAAIGIAWTGVNTVTEAMDFLQAMHKAIPDGASHKLPKKASKRQIVEHMMTTPEAWGQVDIAEGVQEYANMQFGDMVAAAGSKAIKNVQVQQGQLSGLDKAIREATEPWSGAVDGVGMVPELDIDMESGVISVSGYPGVLDWHLSRNSLSVRKE